jgi:hypothetical protein
MAASAAVGMPVNAGLASWRHGTKSGLSGNRRLTGAGVSSCGQAVP